MAANPEAAGPGETPQDVNARLVAKTIPVTVLTGFLGAGKTTLLNRLLADPAMGEAAVLVNEFGEIGIDHLLVRETRDNAVLLNSGCLCCTVRGDLVSAMRELFWQRFDKKVPWFKRLVIETTGLADPAPIIHTLMTEPTIGTRYRLDGIVTVVDAVNGAATLNTQPESVKQAAVADRIVLTKADLADGETLAGIKARLKALNPSAPVLDAQAGVAPADLFDAGLFRADRKIADVAGWLREEAFKEPDHHHGHGGHDHGHDDHGHGHGHGHGHDHGHHHHHDVNRHDARIASFCMTVDRPIPWEAFVTWVEMLITTQGENLLRIKGILNVEGEQAPVAVHGVQHLFHPPVSLPEWPPEWSNGNDHRSRIVFITRDISRQAIEDTFRAFVGAD